MPTSSYHASKRRHFYTPDGRTAALFVDVDGTFIVCEPYFKEARENFGCLMSLLGFNRDQSIKLLRKIDTKAMKKEGFERERFSQSMVETYHKLCQDHRTPSCNSKEIAEICWHIGQSPLFREPVLFPNAAAVLSRSRRHFRMYAVTLGNFEVQQYKICQSGLDAIFDDIIITPYDNKAQLVSTLIEDLKINPQLSAFIGNSQHSDGPCLQHTNFIWLPLEGEATTEPSDLPEHTGFEMFAVKDWREAEEQAIARLLRRRGS